MIGLIIGDILGSKHEFSESPALLSSINFESTSWTDETVFACSVAAALLQNREIVDSLEDYYFYYPAAGWGTLYENWICSELKSDYGSWGNAIAGARIAPHLYLSDGYDAALAASLSNASLTHGHQESLKAVSFVVEFVYKVRSGMSKADLYQFARSAYSFDSPAWVRFDDPLRESCQKSLPVALHALFAGSDFKEAVTMAIQGSSDADSTGAICGLLAGEMYGVPEDWASTTIELLDDRLRAVLESLVDRVGGMDKLGVKSNAKTKA